MDTVINVIVSISAILLWTAVVGAFTNNAESTNMN